jgi:ABC-type branched-subunit amino acid transport system substrate-binding protein
VRTAARYINAHGGLGLAHHAIVVRTCDTQGTPQGEVQCAQQAVADKKAVAAVNPIEIYNPNALTATLQKGGLAAVNPYISTTQQLTNPINFPIVAAYLSGTACSTLTAKATGDKRIGYAQINLPTSEQGDAYAAGVARKAGLTVAGTVTIPVTTTDLSTYIQQLLDDNPQIVVLNMQPGLVAQFVQAAAQLGANWTYCAQDGITEWQQLVGLGSKVDSFYFAATVPQVTQPGSAIVNRFRSQAQAEDASGDKAASLDPSQEPGNAFTAWLAMQVVDQVTQHMPGTITRAGFLHKLAHSTVHLPGALPTIDFAKPNPLPQFRRLFNTRLFLDKWNPSTKTEDPVSSVKPEVFGR